MSQISVFGTRCRRKGGRFLLVFIALSAWSGAAFGFDWPVEKKVLTATFGENRWNHFHDGIDIGGGEQAVHPTEAGEILFTFEEGAESRDLPTGLGSFVVIDHDNGYRSLYAHLKLGSVPVDKTAVSPDDVIGYVGDTGDSLGKHLHFGIVDRTQNEMVNPLTVLPPLGDTTRPVLDGVFFERNKELTRFGTTGNREPGRSQSRRICLRSESIRRVFQSDGPLSNRGEHEWTGAVSRYLRCVESEGWERLSDSVG